MSAPPCSRSTWDTSAWVQQLVAGNAPDPNRIRDALRGVEIDFAVVDDPNDPETAKETARRETLGAYDDTHGSLP